MKAVLADFVGPPLLGILQHHPGNTLRRLVDVFQADDAGTARQETFLIVGDGPEERLRYPSPRPAGEGIGPAVGVKLHPPEQVQQVVQEPVQGRAPGAGEGGCASVR
eukprot:CAMPEP_0194344690 /NCGR_PEP_ID=MMETSP0171-20130528/102555_1 /TAXON_ID=218684 /ORGANISM="Corethron pennatum, Strain L29A3" /LENGTH=106 /DNA_ID=CAMNT_0039111465 /DNA_START=265 /DNA_END=582 /DNA_ORIENTATION=+